MTDFITQFFTSGQLVTPSDMNNFYQGKDQNLTAYFNAYFGVQPTITNGILITQIGTINEFSFTAGTIRFTDQINTISGSLAQATFANVPETLDLNITIPSIGSSPQYYIVIKLTQTVINDNVLTNTAEILDTAMTLAEIAATPNPNQYVVYCAITNTSGLDVTISIDNNCVLFNPLQGLTATNSLSGQPNLTLQNNLIVEGTTTLNTTTVPTMALGDASTNVANTQWAYNQYGIGISASNTAIGDRALGNNTTGTYNSGFGTGALTNNTTGSRNSGFGIGALYQNTTGSYNSGFGTAALYTNATGTYNSGFGDSALTNNTTGSRNSGLGAGALYYNTTGSSNSGFGVNALSNNTVYNNISGFGANAQVTGNNQLQLGDTGTTVYAQNPVQTRSDIRDKADVREISYGLNFITKIKPIEFKQDSREFYAPERPTNNEQMDEYLITCKQENLVADGSKKRNRFHQGVSAQQVKEVMDELNIEFAGYQDHLINGGEDVKTIGYTYFIAPMIKAIQELNEQNQILKNEIEELKTNLKRI